MRILEIKNLTRQFDGVYAINNLSLGVKKGEISGIVGPNGSGKTTLLRILSGMLSTNGGEIFVGGVKFHQIIPHQISSYGFTRTFQEVRLFEQMTVIDNILIVLTERNVLNALFERHKEYHLKKAEEFLRRVGLWEKRSQLAVNLSYGQRKLLEIARALAMDVDIYFFDEPFAGLSPEMRKIISDIIRELKQEHRTIILIEHDMGLIRELCDYIFVLDGGKLLAEGTPAKVLEKREVIEAYLGE